MRLLFRRAARAGRLLALLPFLPAVRADDDARRFEFTELHMGTPFRIVLYAADESTARTASVAAYARIHALDTILSDYDPRSELSRLGRNSGQGRVEKVSPELWLLLGRAQRLSRATQGAFDVTVGPLTTLWRHAAQMHVLPAPATLAEARAHVGFEKLHLDERAHAVELLVPGMRLDFGAIAKGYALDEALAVLRRHGISRALVSGGGDMAAGDPPPGATGWRVAIAPLDVPDAPPVRCVVLANTGLATSGDIFQRVEIDGRRYSHIVDPRTGVGLIDHALVTVIAQDCLTADSLATAVSVLGPTGGLELVEATDGVAATITRKPGERLESVDSARFGDFLEPPARTLVPPDVVSGK